MIMITLIFFVRRMMKKITIYAQAVMRFFLPTLFNHADIWFVPTVWRKKTVNYVDVECSYNITTDEDDFEWYFHDFQCLNFKGTTAHFFQLVSPGQFCKSFTFLCSRHSYKFTDLDKFQKVVDFRHSFYFFSKSKMSYCGTFDTLYLIPWDFFSSIRSYSNLPIRSSSIRFSSCLPW